MTLTQHQLHGSPSRAHHCSHLRKTGEEISFCLNVENAWLDTQEAVNPWEAEIIPKEKA